MATTQPRNGNNGAPAANNNSPLLAHPEPTLTETKTKPSSILSGFFLMKAMLGNNFHRSMFVLLVLTVCNIFVQMHIFLIGVSAKEMQIDQDWGNKQGTGTLYDLLAGPIFTLAHILAILPVGYLVDPDCCISHEPLLCLGMLIWSASIVLTGYSHTYWQVAVYRILLAIFTSFSGPLCISIISGFFPHGIRSSACALWNFSIYIGFSAAYGAGNAIGQYFNNWRFVWWTFGYAGMAWSFLILLIYAFRKTPLYRYADRIDTESEIEISQIDLTDEFLDVLHTYSKTESRIRMLTTVGSVWDRTRNNTGTTIEYSHLDVSALNHHEQIVYQMQQQPVTIGKALCYLLKSPSLLLLVLASFYRNCGGYIWGYQADNLFVIVTGDSHYTVAMWLGWVPMVAGCAGCLFGGIISDKLANNQRFVTPQNVNSMIGNRVLLRICVLVIANLVSSPFAAGVILLQSPYCYLSLFAMYIFSEMWISVSVTLLIEFTPLNMRTHMLSIYYFSMGLAGFAPLFVTFVEEVIGSYKWSMLVLFPGIYGSCSVLFFCLIFTYRRDLNKKINMLSYQNYNF